MRLSAPALLSVVGVAHAGQIAAAPAPPTWGPVMTAPFNQTITIFGFQWSNTVQYFYDSTTSPVGSSLSAHSQGQHDEICTGVAGFEFSSQPCNLIASSDTWRYVYFPQSNFCCRFCNTTDYCGIISPSWLQTNATYQGQRLIDGVNCNGWMKQGGEDNYAWFTADANQQPAQYYEGYPTFDIGSNYWNFTLGAFSRSPIPASTFALPTTTTCSSQCPQSALTYQERLQGAFKHA